MRTRHLWTGIVAASVVALGMGLAGCAVEGEVAAPGVAVEDVGPDAFVGFYDTAPGPDFYYHYRVVGNYHYLDRYHRGPNGWRVEHSYRVPTAQVHRQFNAHDHERFERH